MAGNIDAAHANNVLDASLGTASLTATTTPLKLALMSAAGTNAVAGTEVTGGSYARQTITFTAAATVSNVPSTANSAVVTFTNMPAITTAAIELYDSAGTPKRKWQGNLASSKTTGAGDTLSFAVGAVAVTMP